MALLENPFHCIEGNLRDGGEDKPLLRRAGEGLCGDDNLCGEKTSLAAIEHNLLGDMGG